MDVSVFGLLVTGEGAKKQAYFPVFCVIHPSCGSVTGPELQVILRDHYCTIVILLETLEYLCLSTLVFGTKRLLQGLIVL